MLSMSGRSHISELTFSCSPYGFIVLILTVIFMNKSDLPLNNHNKFQHLICFDLDAQHQQVLLHRFFLQFFFIFLFLCLENTASPFDETC